MAAFKTGLDYSPTPTDFFNSYQAKRIKRFYGLTGTAICLKLISEAYKTEGYYLEVSDEVVLDNAEYAGIQEEKFKEMVECFCDIGMFDKQLYKEYSILTSLDIQQRYINANLKLRRSTLNIKEDFRLISEDEYKEAMIQKKKTKNKDKKDEDTEAAEQPCTPQRTPPKHNSKKYNDTATLFNMESEETTENMNDANGVNYTNDVEIPTMKRNEMKRNEMNTPPPTPPIEKRRGDNAKAEKVESILPLPSNLTPAERNYDCMIQSLTTRNIPISEINTILRLSDYGRIGHPAWKAIFAVSNSPGKFKMPGRFIISEITKKR